MNPPSNLLEDFTSSHKVKMLKARVFPFLYVPGDSFMISTVSNKNDAHLLVYQMKLTNRRDYEAKLNRTLKKFTSKPITQVYEGCIEN